ncbi:hypothetical protein, partial [Serratia marcescens]|uniref:hypothetical protein n=1 Tax=Serratia marcescens TaxID=615 RepID=UPI001954583C
LPGWQQGVVVWWDSFYAYFSTKWTYRLILTFIGKPWQPQRNERAMNSRLLIGRNRRTGTTTG